MSMSSDTRALHCHVEGTQSIGRQQKKWTDNVIEDTNAHNLDRRTRTDLARDMSRSVSVSFGVAMEAEAGMIIHSQR